MDNNEIINELSAEELEKIAGGVSRGRFETTEKVKR